MGKFYLHRGNKLIGVGSCPDGLEQYQAVDGMEVGLGDPPASIQPVIEAQPEGYDFQRLRAYPTSGDQLDAIWKLLGPQAPAGSDAAAMYQRILAVKQKYPKPPAGNLG